MTYQKLFTPSKETLTQFIADRLRIAPEKAAAIGGWTRVEHLRDWQNTEQCRQLREQSEQEPEPPSAA